MKVLLERLIVERLESPGIVEILAHRIRRAVGIEDFDSEHLGPPVLVGAAKQRTDAAVVERAASAFGIAGFHVHDSGSFVFVSEWSAPYHAEDFRLNRLILIQ
jgi:hypothetical protein